MSAHTSDSSDSESSQFYPLSAENHSDITSWLHRIHPSHDHDIPPSPPESIPSRSASPALITPDPAFVESLTPTSTLPPMFAKHYWDEHLGGHRCLVYNPTAPPLPMEEIDAETGLVLDVEDAYSIKRLLAHIQYIYSLEQLHASYQALAHINRALKSARQEVARVRDYHYNHGLASHFKDLSIQQHRAFMNTQFCKMAEPHLTTFYNKLESFRQPPTPNVFAISDAWEREMRGMGGRWMNPG